jgi:hypothetical protein
MFTSDDMGKTAREWFAGYSSMEKEQYAACDVLCFPSPQDPKKWAMGVWFGWSSPDLDAGRKYLERLTKLTAGADFASIREQGNTEVSEMVGAFAKYGVQGMDAVTAINFGDMSGKPAEVLGNFFNESPAADQGNAIILHEARGASVEPQEESCFGARQPHWVVQIVCASLQAENVGASTRLSRKLYSALKAAGEALEVTYASLAQTKDTDMSKQFGKDYEFVMSLKNKYDPDGMFDNTVPRLRP